MPITYKHLYPQIYDFAALHAAYRRARLGKRARPDALEFRRNLESNLIQLQNELIWKTYRTGAYRFFLVHEPKQRQVAALPFRDRVLQHALVGVLEPIFEPRFSRDSYACRVGKGTHAGTTRAQQFLRRIQREHGRVFVFKADIAKYFASIHHEALKRILRRHIACPDTLWLVDSIIDSTGGDCGLPIGNLTSQLFANVYLHQLDRFVKQELREPFYLRYMDDFCVVSPDKAHLHQVRRRVEEFLGEQLGLRLNQKTAIFPVSRDRGRALDFLGFRIYPTHLALRKSSGLRMQRGLRHLARRYHAGRCTLERIQASIASWLGHCRHCRSYHVRRRVMGSVVLRSAAEMENCV